MKTLLYNAKVRLGRNLFCESIGFDSSTGKIVFSGSNLDANKKLYDESIDLKRKLVLPAFSDGHCHFIKGSTMKKELNLQNASTKKDFETGIKEFLSAQKNKSWLIGGYFSETNFTEDFVVDRYLLDSVCPDVPVFIFRTDLHSAVINSLAIKLSGIEGKLPEFGSGEIVLNKNNKLTGELKERGYYYVLNKIPKQSNETVAEAVSDEIKFLHRLGINSVTDITLPEDYRVYKFMNENNYSFDFDINCVLPFEEFNNFLIKKYPQLSDNFSFGSFKAFYDGALSSHSAYFFENYKGLKTNGLTSELVHSGDFKKIGLEIDKAGYQLMIHGIGDKAISEILDFTEELNLFNGKRNRRLRLEHAQHIDDKDLIRFKELNVIASVQPSHLFVDANVACQKLNNTSTAHNYKKLIEQETVVCFGTDFPVAAENPFETIYYAMTRKAKDFENGFYPEKALTLDECLDAYTINNAYAKFDENNSGSMSAGKTANIIILENDLFEIEKSEIKEQNIIMNFYRGKRVY